VPRALAASFFVPLGVAAAAANLATGWLADRYASRMLLEVALLIFGVVLWIAPLVKDTAPCTASRRRS